MTQPLLSSFDHIIPEKIFEAVEMHGGRCTGRFMALNAMENRVYDVEMEDEANRVVKFYRPGRWTKEMIEAEHAFLKKMEHDEIPVVCPMEKAGQTLLEIEKVFFAVFPKKPGRLEPELNPEQLKKVGRFLARIHNTGESMKGVKRATLTPTTFGRDSLKVLQEGNFIPGNLNTIYSQLVNQTCDLIEPLFKNVETILTHGDCHAGNVLWKDENPYFIDFDDMLYAPPVQDMWMLIGGDDEYAMKNRDVLIDAYMEIREFDERSWKLVEPLRALRMIYFVTWIARRKDDGAFKLAFPHFGTERYWQEQVENISNQAERVKRQIESDQLA